MRKTRSNHRITSVPFSIKDTVLTEPFISVTREPDSMLKRNYGKIQVLVTGGTIDSEFDPKSDTTKVREKTIIPEYVKKSELNLYNKLVFQTVFMKDSREIRHQDRKKLLEAIKKSKYKMILVTHGTYTMPDSSQYVKDELEKTDKVVVFIGSMIPLIGGREFSDSGFNFGYAIAQLQSLPAGVYICMNGKVFDPENVDKNKVIGRFEEVQSL